MNELIKRLKEGDHKINDLTHTLTYERDRNQKEIEAMEQLVQRFLKDNEQNIYNNKNKLMHDNSTHHSTAISFNSLKTKEGSTIEVMVKLIDFNNKFRMLMNHQRWC